MQFKFECPYCNQYISAEPEHTGLRGGCPGCGKEIVVPTFPIIRSVLPFVPHAPPAIGTTPASSLAKSERAALPARTNQQEGFSIGKLTAPEIFWCLLMVVPAILAAKLSGATLSNFITGMYAGADWVVSADDERANQFISCAAAGFVFVWIGHLCTKSGTKILQRYVGTIIMERFAVLLFVVLGTIAALALYPMNGVGGLLGQIGGLLLAAYFYGGIDPLSAKFQNRSPR